MNIPDNATPDIILLRGKRIEVYSCDLPHEELLFYADNPRIYSIVREDYDDEPSQEDIFKVLSKAEHVRDSLIPSIRHNGGLIEPILVRGNVVLEGNSRLAAYRVLSLQDPNQWKYIRAKVLPPDVTDSQVFSLLGEYHMVGKKDWLPFEQAGYLYRRFKHHEITIEALSEEVGLKKNQVSHLISVYQYMVDNDERASGKWSFYDELLKGRTFKEAQALYPDFYRVVTEKIKNGDIKRAVDLRDDLPLIVKAGRNTLKKFLKGTTDFPEALEEARTQGIGGSHYPRLKSFRQWLAEASIDDAIREMSTEERTNVKFELDRIHTRTGQLSGKIKSPQKH